LSATYPQPSAWTEFAWRLRPVRRERLACHGFDDVSENLPDAVRAFVCDSYPRNHTYVPEADRLVPHRKLAVRVAGLSRYYPAPLTSLLDLSCSKGFFVFHAAAHESCERALGIDLSDECLDTCRLLNARFARRERVGFERLTLPELATRIDEFGGPFQTALLINTYQYLFFGSPVAPAVGQDHREIFRLLRFVCSGRLIFHNRLALADLQSDPQERAARGGTGRLYDPVAIRQAAEEFFRLTTVPKWLGHPVWLLDAR
jgi:hypothetical protein